MKKKKKKCKSKDRSKPQGQCQHIYVKKLCVSVHVFHAHEGLCVCVYCMRAYFKKQAQKRRTELIIKKMKEWMSDWMLKAKMVQKAWGDWRVDKPKWEEWWTVAQTSAALIPIFLYDLSNILIWVSIFSSFFFGCFFFCIQTKEIKQIIKQLKILNSAATGEIWLMSQRTLIPSGFCSPAVSTLVVSYGCKLSAQADCDVGVKQPPGHQGGVVEVVKTVYFLSLLWVAQ